MVKFSQVRIGEAFTFRGDLYIKQGNGAATKVATRRFCIFRSDAVVRI